MLLCPLHKVRVFQSLVAFSLWVANGSGLNYCGVNWVSAGDCHRECPSGVDSECLNSESCFADIDCGPPTNTNYCGNDWSDSLDCHRPCPSGENSECDPGEFCFADVTCTQPNSNYCGNDWTGSLDCHRPCPSGENSECDPGEFCFADVTCTQPNSNYCGNDWTGSLDCHRACPTGLNMECFNGESCFAGVACVFSSPSRNPSSKPSIISSSKPQIKPSTTPSSSPSIRPSFTITTIPSSKPSAIPTIIPSTKIPTSVNPSTTPTKSPSKPPSAVPSTAPSLSPTTFLTTKSPTEPSSIPSPNPSVVPTVFPTSRPTSKPSVIPTAVPTLSPTSKPSVIPTSKPSVIPTAVPTLSPTSKPSVIPTSKPSVIPTAVPTSRPTSKPSVMPTAVPTSRPTSKPSVIPTSKPSVIPTAVPTSSPTSKPSVVPTAVPTVVPSTKIPTFSPSVIPSTIPSTKSPSKPSVIPSSSPSKRPSAIPTAIPTTNPSLFPSPVPTTKSPSKPSSIPSPTPSVVPTVVPTSRPTSKPSVIPTVVPTLSPTSKPSYIPTAAPTSGPTSKPSVVPTAVPTAAPSTKIPTFSPSVIPSTIPSTKSPSKPSVIPSSSPSKRPSAIPTAISTSRPASTAPSLFPSSCPTIQSPTKPSLIPSLTPSVIATAVSSVSPKSNPSVIPLVAPTAMPSSKPLAITTAVPTAVQSSKFSAVPTDSVSLKPSCKPSVSPSSTKSFPPTSRVMTVGFYTWTYAYPLSKIPFYATSTISYSGFSDVYAAINSSRSVLSTLQGKRFICLGGPDYYGSWSIATILRIGEALSGNALTNYTGICVNIVNGDAGLSSYFSSVFSALKSRGFSVLVSFPLSGPTSISDGRDIIRNFLLSRDIDILSPQLYSVGQSSDETNYFDTRVIGATSWNVFNSSIATIVPSIFNVSYYSRAVTFLLSQGINIEGYFQFQQNFGIASSQSFCGTTITNASDCHKSCLSGLDSECSSGEKCLTGITCRAVNSTQQNFCGINYLNSSSCSRPCPSGLDSECRNGMKCFTGVHCGDYLKNSNPLNNFCGYNLTSAKQCSFACPTGLNSSCPSGQQCFTNTTCTVSLNSTSTNPDRNFCGNLISTNCGIPCPLGKNTECPAGTICRPKQSCKDGDLIIPIETSYIVPIVNPNNSYCGATIAAARDCHRPCPSGLSAECTIGETCFQYVSTTCSVVPTVRPSPVPDNPPLELENPWNSYCGGSLADALSCGIACPLGIDRAWCPLGQQCFSNLTCADSARMTALTTPDLFIMEPKSFIPKSYTLPHLRSNPNDNYCGADYSQSTSCQVECPQGLNSECPSGQSCFAQVTCSSGGGSPSGSYCGSNFGAAAFCQNTCSSGLNYECQDGESCYSDVICSSNGGGSSSNFCGTDYAASTDCLRQCPSGLDSECGPGEFCFGGVTCGGALPADAECGINGKTCPLSACCSQYGYCGWTADFCNSKCLSNCEFNIGPPTSCDSSLKMKVNFGYYASWASSRVCVPVMPRDINAAGYTHLAYSFAAISTSFQLIPTDSSELSLYREFTNLKLSNPGLKCILAVGGWGFNDPPTQHIFSDMVSSSASRTVFIASVLSMLRSYNFDGLDLDWEYPSAPDRGGSPSDASNYVLLVSELRTAFDSAPEKFQLSMAVPLSNWYLRGFDVKGLTQYVDFFNVMSYDIHGTWDSGIKSLGSHVLAHTNMTEIKEGIQMFWKNGVPSSKLVLGLGAYSRSFTLADPGCTLPGCPFISGSDPGRCTGASGFLALFEIQEILAQRSIQPVFDAASGTMIVVFDGDQWASYDSEQSFAVKLAYASDSCMRGTMVWSVDMMNGGLTSTPIFASPRDYSEAVNVKFDGGDIGAYFDGSFAECRAECDRREGCVAYLTNKLIGRGCWLKWVITIKYGDSSADLFYLKSSKIYIPILGQNFPGKDISFADIPRNLCSQQCDNTKGCVAFTLKLDSPRGCWMKSGLTDESVITSDRDTFFHMASPDDPEMQIPGFEDLPEVSNEEDPDFCWIWSSGRGVGIVPNQCPDGYRFYVGLCYPRCKDGYAPTFLAFYLCLSDCPPGYSQTTQEFCHLNSPAVISPGCDWNSDYSIIWGGRCYHRDVNVGLLLKVPEYSGCPGGYVTFPLTCTGCSGTWPWEWRCNTLNRSPACPSGYDLSCAGSLCGSCVAKM